MKLKSETLLKIVFAIIVIMIATAAIMMSILISKLFE